ncbi:MAG: Rha family transcriptional regulator [Clostridium sp.]|uniref:Rha family transcriptional regulator n=1 Tax=Clostridium sp. TaxID=1506 RepID=UPI00290A2F84|nr:Rha family transcriptional regulator [Clostridium sp.]
MNKQLENRISSREVADMMEMEHKRLLRKIDGINEDFVKSKIGLYKYWEESFYINESNNKPCREFLITKRGCEFLAHKTTGTKGNLFTDRYMDRFERMEKLIQSNLPVGLETMQGIGVLSESMAAIGKHVQVLTEFTMGMKEYVQDSIKAKDHQIDEAMNLIGLRAKNVSKLTGKLKEELYKHYGREISATSREYMNAKIKVFKEFDVIKWEEIPVNKYNAVYAFLEVMFD